MVTSHIHLGNVAKNGCSCTSSPTYNFMTYTRDDLIFTHHMNTLSFTILYWSVKCTGEWPPMPYAGFCVSTWKKFKISTLRQKISHQQEIQMAFQTIYYKVTTSV